MFAFFVNGVNCALVPGTAEPVDVDTVNAGNPGGDTTPHHPDLFRDNTDGHLSTELDGLTTVLTCRARVNPGQHNTLSLEIADSADQQYDSDVFVGAGSIESTQTGVTTALHAGSASGTALTVVPGTPVTDQAVLTGDNASDAAGTVTYTVYSDASCTMQVADAGTKSVTAGVVPESYRVPSATPGTVLLAGRLQRRQREQRRDKRLQRRDGDRLTRSHRAPLHRCDQQHVLATCCPVRPVD